LRKDTRFLAGEEKSVRFEDMANILFSQMIKIIVTMTKLLNEIEEIIILKLS